MEYRDRLEGPIGIGYQGTNDFYVLDRLRVTVAIQPKDWLKFYGEVQDSRIFFNHHIPNANPFEDSWTLWQGYVQVGSSTSGWVDALAGRQVLLFGDERVIGPSNWTNVGRTFDVARVDIHHPGYEVAVFGSSVVPGSNSFLHRAIPGNNLYGVYASFQNIIPRVTFEPYVLWRLAPGNFGLPETVGRGHLNEVTIGLHVKGTRGLPSIVRNTLDRGNQMHLVSVVNCDESSIVGIQRVGDNCRRLGRLWAADNSPRGASFCFTLTHQSRGR